MRPDIVIKSSQFPPPKWPQQFLLSMYQIFGHFGRQFVVIMGHSGHTVALVLSTHDCQCDQIWWYCATLAKHFDGLFSILQNFESTLAKALCYWGKISLLQMSIWSLWHTPARVTLFNAHSGKSFRGLNEACLGCDQCDQIGQFIALWASFQCLWQQLFCQNCPHF